MMRLHGRILLSIMDVRNIYRLIRMVLKRENLKEASANRFSLIKKRQKG
ncbi:hypothetical protein AJ85_18110 [Alkalihalobacillus alcalophilus ATCC 27647 = CGMCC 1.3604]|uniref:Uncharacterized protein n=1 Tax=Alkalihalobacillus alcalophilus ATCC 27647 = CGMCC 1.3604 TaxID=1218173 RepID=A0A4S4JVY9_ALKAL|nr:hypothetical protein AJ85_18110 [Alkalihalobacillus alcalophilus ATCC 27647 = CGMCC 1.3604]